MARPGPLQRGDSSGPQAPAVAALWARSRLHRDGSWKRLSTKGETWLFSIENERLIFKAPKPAGNLRELVAIARAAAAVGIGPDVVDWVDTEEGGWLVLRYVDGIQPAPADREWHRLWARIPSALYRLGRVSATGPDLVKHWTDTLLCYPFPEVSARRLQERVAAAPWVQQDGFLAHGDFSPQNMVLVNDDIVLIDWELAGRAPEGFDAGWLLALTRTGIVQAPCGDERLEQLLTGGRVPLHLIHWYRELGLLRLLWRAHTLPMGEVHRNFLRAQVLLAIGL